LGGALAYAQFGTLDRLLGSDPAADEEAPIEYGEFKEITGLIVNPAGTGGSRYLMVSVGFESASADPLAEIEEKNVVVRDTVIALLSAHSVEALTDYARRDGLKAEIRTAVNSILRRGEIDRLYFTQYILQ
ncbi:MAG: flagellar basal body-associated FliL family protein, partial [Rhodothermales bacterium]|nr:flagellar basal body-associated FliL family protein [Rhodothermales bacterium]